MKTRRKGYSVFGFAPPILILVIAILGVVGYFGYENLKNSTNKVAKIERVTLQDGYYFDVTIPKGFTLKNGSGDYVSYVVDSDGTDLIGFQKTWGGGELSPLGMVTIDKVPLTIDYKKDIGCPVTIYSNKANNPQKMSFGITTWCKDESGIQLPVYKEVLESIVFSPKLKEVLLGSLSEPIPSPVSGNTSDISKWKTYTDKTNSYSIEYPKDWYVSNSSSNEVSFASFTEDQLTNQEKKDVLGGLKTDVISIKLGVYEGTIIKGTSLLSWLKNNDQYISAMSGAPTSEKETSIAGNPGLLLNYNGTGPFYVFSAGSHVFYTFYSPSGSKLAGVFEQIISTFKLLK